MSNIFIKSNDLSFLDSATESQMNLLSHVKIVDKKMTGGGNYQFSETSVYSKQNFKNINDSETSLFSLKNKANIYNRQNKMSGGANEYSDTSAYSKQMLDNINDSETSIYSKQNNMTGGMNNIFVNLLNNNLSETSENNQNISLSTSDIKSSSLIKNLVGGNLNNVDSETKIQQLLDMISSDSNAVNQKGGNDNDINKLLDMLTTDSNDSFKEYSENATTELEKQLESIINKNQSGGFNKYSNINNLFVKNQSGGDKGLSVHQIKDFFNNLKLNGVDVNIKLDDHTMSEYFDLMHNSTTDINQAGGRGANPAFQALMKLRKIVASKFNIPNGPPAVKIASAMIKDIKATNPSYDSVKAADEAIKTFDKISNKYKSMIKK